MSYISSPLKIALLLLLLLPVDYAFAKKVPVLTSLSRAQLQESSSRCYKYPNEWAFVVGVDSTLKDYTNSLEKISGDSGAEVLSNLRKENRGIRFSKLALFSYVRVPQKYTQAFREKFDTQISQQNANPSCRSTIRPSRLYVVPSDMSVSKLLQRLGETQRHSSVILANQIAEINSNVRPGARLSKGDVILMPQSYPYTHSLLPSGNAVKSDVASGSEESNPNEELDSTGVDFIWSLGYFSHLYKVEGEDHLAGGNFKLVTDRASDIELSLGVDFDPSDRGALALSVIVNSLSYAYKQDNFHDVNLRNVRLDHIDYKLRGYWQDSESSMGYGSEIGRLHVTDISRSSLREAAVVESYVPFIAAFTKYKPSDKIFGLGYGGLAKANFGFSSEDYSDVIALDLGVFVLWPLSADYDLSFDLGYRKSKYKKTNKSFTGNTLYSGISIQAF